MKVELAWLEPRRIWDRRPAFLSLAMSQLRLLLLERLGPEPLNAAEQSISDVGEPHLSVKDQPSPNGDRIWDMPRVKKGDP
jgi:hypothetical protein